ncbi:MAG TPA: elongation factor P maturation arginine rhamnosyltransferase EarP, partial [Caldimonas sp.]|nr:elongation factor P maturation arginine rhamnosyltransferase EarP [Caldimonas sp.]
RLSAGLAARGESVRLALDEQESLSWLAPSGAPGVAVGTWREAAVEDADVWVETFGCGMPPQASPSRRRVLVNVEHLSAEPYVDRSHAKPSPRFDADGATLTTWFYYPGFRPANGGLIREPGLLDSRRRFGHGIDWLRARGIEKGAGERCVSLFCYANDAFEACLDALSRSPTLLLLTPGPATEQAILCLGPDLRRGSLRAVRLPAMPQVDFDHLIWTGDLAFVRGEDSLVRAIWSGVPFVWQLYPQDDEARAAKLHAFIDLFLEGAAPELAPLRRLFAIWNGLVPAEGFVSALDAIDMAVWRRRCLVFRERLAARPDLCELLVEFAAQKR